MGCFDSPSVKMQSTLTPAQQSYVKTGLNNVSTGLQRGITPYQGARVPGETELQNQYFSMVPQVASQQLAGLSSLASSEAPLDAMYQYGQRYAEDVLTPTVMERFAGMGTSDSGGAMKGLARELGTYGLGLNAQIGQTSLQNQAQQLQALSQMGQVPQGLGTAGAMQYDTEAQRLAAEQQKWAEAQTYNNPWYNIGSSFMGQYTTPVQQSGGMGYSMLSGLAGSEGVGNAMGAGLMKLASMI